MILSILNKKIRQVVLIAIFIALSSSISVGSAFTEKDDFSNSLDGLTFSNLRSEFFTTNKDDYYNFLRISIIEQPEYAFAISNTTEKNMLLKYNQRNRFPTLDFRLINDRSIKRDVDDFTSIRKRRDDSFDAAVEINQPIYTGGSISSRIKMARIDYAISEADKNKAFSELIVDANRIYLEAVKSEVLFNYGSKILEELSPFQEKVRDRVTLGISDPIELAIFSIKFNSLSSQIQKLRTDRNRDIGIFEYFLNSSNFLSESVLSINALP